MPENTLNVPMDKRTIDRYVEKGLIDKKAYETYLAKLPDDTANAEWVQTDLLEADFSDTGDDAHRIESSPAIAGEDDEGDLDLGDDDGSEG